MSLVEKSITILRETRAQFKNPAVLWSTGKDSTVMLALIKEAFFDEIPWNVVHLDTGLKFQEMYDFRTNIQALWNFQIVTNTQGAFKHTPESGRGDCCTERKTNVLKFLIQKRGYDAIVVSIRRDEHGIRNKERYMSPRDKDFHWKPYVVKDGKVSAGQDLELSGWGLYESDFGPDASHVRVHPILHWTELDIWNYIKEKRLPVNPMYFSKNGERYRSLGCRPCTSPIKSNASTVDDIIEELKTTTTAEREGRAQDKEDAYMMQRLRCLGYM